MSDIVFTLYWVLLNTMENAADIERFYVKLCIVLYSSSASRLKGDRNFPVDVLSPICKISLFTEYIIF